ncbi:MAG TPA: transglycosylase SLT domain-containing protein [Actinospica sp.]|nr:transglycosylase SLT domain-containing protein [Actinospica sp.]
MAASDHYQVDIESVKALIRSWQNGSDELGAISNQLTQIHEELTRCVPSALFEGALGDLPLAASFAKVAAAASAAHEVAGGLAQDTASLDANLASYTATEAEVEARLKAIGNRHHPGHGGGGGGGGGSGGVRPPRPAQYANQSQVESWINQAFQVLEASGTPANELDLGGVLLIIEHESSGNPNAINDWDSNAQAGDPSRGLMQVIGATFDAYKLPGHEDIYNPVDNIIAGVRYALARYGSIQNVPGVRSVEGGGSYVGY